ncbi:MAG: FAD-binding oxidoreductase [Actinobacteria bacterium]|nr:FAD-binding oxidoreductase [Actinomycetota bacterium]
MEKTRSWWGWGYEQSALSEAERSSLASLLGESFGADLRRTIPPAPEDLVLPAPRVVVPESLGAITRTDARDRASHSFGKSYRDVIRAVRGEITHPPDAVMHPRTDQDVVDILDWCSSAHVAAIPYGGGSSVVGGVEPLVGEGYAGVVSVDLGALDRVLEIDTTSRSARVQAGVLGPSLEDQLRVAGLTLRHFPQSFEVSSLGGWIATRAGGHFATLYTHIDDLVESVKVVAPSGVVETRRLPGSGAGPSADRLFIGSEGVLGIVTEAWVRLHARPLWRAQATASFAELSSGVQAARALSQSGLFPSNCRLLDGREALIGGAGDGSSAVLLVAFESADHPLEPWIARAIELCRDYGGIVEGPFYRSEPGHPTHAFEAKSSSVPATGGMEHPGKGAAASWRRSFMRAPYVRDALAISGVLSETFETAITWERFFDLYARVNQAVREAMEEVGAGSGWLTCRFTHLYPDGPAPYFTVVAPARYGDELAQWQVIKEAASAAVLDAGGTITHHHAIGRDHRRFYDAQRPPLFGQALAAVKAVLDPAGICNPGVLLDPQMPHSP